MGTSIPSTPLNDIANAGVSEAAGFTTSAGILGAVGSMGTSLLFQAGLSIVFGLASSLFRRKPRPRRGRDLQLGLADPTTFLPIVYGSHRVTGLRTFAYTTGNGTSGDARYLWVVASLCHGPIAGIDEVYLDGYLAVTASNQAVGSAYLVSTGRTAPIPAREDYAQVVTCWKAYGTDGQLMYEPRTNARTITGNSRKDSSNRYVDFSATHPYLVGDTLSISGIGASGISDGTYFVSDVPSTTRVTIGYPAGGTLTPYTGLTGACDYYNPDLPTELAGSNWGSTDRGAGVAYVLLRLVYDEVRFPNGIPEIECNVRGIALKDPRSVSTGTITTSATSATIPRHPAAALITESAAHGLTAGSVVVITGHSLEEVNGTHRVFDAPSSTTYRLPISLSGSGSGGTRTTLAMSTTPALCIRDFLTNSIYGAGASAAEIDDTALGTEATYHESANTVGLDSQPGVTYQRGCSQIIVSAGVATGTTTNVPHAADPFPPVLTHNYAIGQTAWIGGFSDVASGVFNGLHTITAIPSSHEFSFATAAANGTYACDLRVSALPKSNRNDLATTTRMGRVTISTSSTMFSCNGIADPSQSLQRTLEELLSACRGQLVYQSGLFRLSTRRTATPLATFALTDDTIVGDVTLTVPGQQDAANVVIATFPNIAANYQQDTVSFPQSYDTNPLLIADNNTWLRKEIDLPFTSQKAIAQQICMVLRNESRARVMQCVATEAALLAQVGDVVNVTREVYGFTAKPFRIITMAAREDDLIELTLAEHSDTWYTPDPSDDITAYSKIVPTTYQPPTTNISLQDWRNLGINSHAGSGSLDSGLTIGYTLLGGNLSRIDVSAHTLRVPIAASDYLDISYSAGTFSINGSDATTRNIPWYVYTYDPTLAGGAVGYAAVTTQPDSVLGSGFRYLGKITIPSGTSGSGSTGTPYSRSKS